MSKVRRTVLGFSLRLDATRPLGELLPLLEQALGCTLAEGDYHGTPVLKSELLGMRILLSRWRGLARAETYQLHGLVDDPRYVQGADIEDIEINEINISEAVIDLLLLRGAGAWRVPSLAEVEAEIAYGEEMRLAFLTTEEDAAAAANEDE